MSPGSHQLAMLCPGVRSAGRLVSAEVLLSRRCSPSMRHGGHASSGAAGLLTATLTFALLRVYCLAKDVPFLFDRWTDLGTARVKQIACNRLLQLKVDPQM